MNQLKRARDAHKALSLKLRNENEGRITTWLERVKKSMGVQQLPNWYTTKCPIEISGYDDITETLEDYTTSPEAIKTALKLLVCYGISLGYEREHRTPSFTMEFIAGFFKTKNDELTAEQIKALLNNAMKNMTIPSENEIPSLAREKILEYAKNSRGRI